MWRTSQLPVSLMSTLQTSVGVWGAPTWLLLGACMRRRGSTSAAGGLQILGLPWTACPPMMTGAGGAEDVCWWEEASYGD